MSTTVVVPEELKKKFPKLVELIFGSESMNDDERQYWINILPAMTPEQQANLQQILQKEKDQLAAIDAKYEKEISSIGQGKSIEEIRNAREARRRSRAQSEQSAEQEEHKKEQEILSAIAKLES